MHFKLRGDWLFWIKLAELGDIVYTIVSLNYFRIHQNTVRLKTNHENIFEKESELIYNHLVKKNIISRKKFEIWVNKNKYSNILSNKNTILNIFIYTLKKLIISSKYKYIQIGF